MSNRPFSSESWTSFLSKFKSQGFTLKDPVVSNLNTVTESGIYTVAPRATGTPVTNQLQALLLHIRDTHTSTTRHWDVQFFSGTGVVFVRTRYSYSSSNEQWNSWIQIQSPPSSPLKYLTDDSGDLDTIKETLCHLAPGSGGSFAIIFGSSYDSPFTTDNGITVAGTCLLTNSGENYDWTGIMRQSDGSLMSILVTGDALDSGDIEEGLTITATPIPSRYEIERYSTYMNNSLAYTLINAAQQWKTASTKALCKAYGANGGLIWGGLLQWTGNSNGQIANRTNTKYSGSGSLTASNEQGTIAFSETPAFVEMHYLGAHD